MSSFLPGRLFQRSISLTTIPSRQDFFFWPDYLSPQEQTLLLRASLQKLDSTESRRFQRRRKTLKIASEDGGALDDLFLPDDYYDFQEGHYDGVIRRYREMHLTSWPEDVIPGLSPVLQRLFSLCPTKDTQTHLLHLATDGEILPHVDNLSASGSWILGVSLGSERVLRMENTSREQDGFCISLPSGSVYLQRDSIRFSYKHSILPRRPGDRIGQRLSVMIRVWPVDILQTGQLHIEAFLPRIDLLRVKRHTDPFE